MSMFATICNTEFSPLTGDIEVETDAGFSDIEARAQELAAAGTKCCIRWTRSGDGQAAYWGPSGAALRPHWYAKSGRATEMENGRRVNVYLDSESLAIAEKLGNGNVSDGIRKALARQQSGATQGTLDGEE